MWDRVELKRRGKAAYRANRFMSILAALIITICEGSYGVSSFNGASHNDTPTQDYDSVITTTSQTFSDPSSTLAVAGVSMIVLVVVIAAILLAVLVFNPLMVGARKFFIKNATDSNTGLDDSTLGVGFGENWKHVIGSVFTTQIFVFLWTLCLIVPGVIKSYAWRMVPYIIAENPTISGEEARKKSEQMMDGSKMETFIMDLSFMGWYILGAFTLGILNLVFVNPYKEASFAELYLTLDNRAVPEIVPETLVQTVSFDS